ncbi:MAG: hopanoid biosynthesis associated radical SAM protein HpnJ, partial [Acidobacteriia bacterium]|nr:hopanoid biosynthesis associated radical SAM protein HpnJ [Terriglobia bacterium]
AMSDEAGHQIPNFSYPGLSQADLVEWVERFYAEYFFRPRAAWRIVRKAVFDGHERKRLYKEAREYMALRTKRKKYIAASRSAGQSVAAGAQSGD